MRYTYIYKHKIKRNYTQNIYVVVDSSSSGDFYKSFVAW